MSQSCDLNRETVVVKPSGKLYWMYMSLGFVEWVEKRFVLHLNGK